LAILKIRNFEERQKIKNKKKIQNSACVEKKNKKSAYKPPGKNSGKSLEFFLGSPKKKTSAPFFQNKNDQSS
jgi:hypothetical protein